MNETRGARPKAKTGLVALSMAGLALGAAACSGGILSTQVASGGVGPSTTLGIGTSTTIPVGAGSTAGSTPAGHAAMPTRPAKVVSQLSANWAGPVLIGGIYDRVDATFVIPQATCSAADTSSSFWAGIDGGGTSTTVEQAGVRESCVDGTAQYFPWTEEAPAPEDDIDPSQFTVAAGDTLAIDVGVNSTTDSYTLDDVTSGVTYTTSADAPLGAADNSAECVAEAPTEAGSIDMLANFGSVTFSKCQAKVVSPVAAADCQLVSSNGCPPGSHIVFSNIGHRKYLRTKLQAETMSTTGGGFTVTWHHS